MCHKNTRRILPSGRLHLPEAHSGICFRILPGNKVIIHQVDVPQHSIEVETMLCVCKKVPAQTMTLLFIIIDDFYL